MQKLYLYVDESGQDTAGVRFIVVVVLSVQEAVSSLEQAVEQVEQETGKQRRKWTQTRHADKIAYLTRLMQLSVLAKCIFYASYHQRQDYRTDHPDDC